MKKKWLVPKRTENPLNKYEPVWYEVTGLRIVPSTNAAKVHVDTIVHYKKDSEQSQDTESSAFSRIGCSCPQCQTRRDRVKLLSRSAQARMQKLHLAHQSNQCSSSGSVKYETNNESFELTFHTCKAALTFIETELEDFGRKKCL